MADAVYKIDEDGHLVTYQFPASSDGGDREIASSSNDSDEDSTDQISATQDQDVKGKEGVKFPSGDKKEHADPASIGDRQVYKVYYNSIGPVHASILVLGMMAFAVTLKFPGAYHPPSCLIVLAGEELTIWQISGLNGGPSTPISATRPRARVIGSDYMHCSEFYLLLPGGLLSGKFITTSTTSRSYLTYLLTHVPVTSPSKSSPAQASASTESSSER